MIINGHNSEVLLASYPETLGNLLALAQRALDEGPKFQNAIIASDGLYVKKFTSGYLVISPKDQRFFNADQDLQPIEIDYNIPLVDLEVISGTLEHILNTQVE